MVKITLRLDDELHALITAAAAADQRSLNTWILRALRAALLSAPAATRRTALRAAQVQHEPKPAQ